MYDAEYIIEAIKNHEILFQVMDIKEFPKSKWHLLDISDSNISIIIRGSTMQETNRYYSQFKEIIKEAKEIFWHGKCHVYRLFEFN
jgi:hypothetical protein